MSNRTPQPFFASFFAAFRAHTLQSQAVKATASTLSPSSQSSHTTNPTSSNASTFNPSNPRTITTKSSTTATTLSQLHAPRSNQASPRASPERDCASPPTYNGSPTYVNKRDRVGAQRMERVRRGSDSSTEGFRDVLGAEKWYIGGRTVTGEERFFKLGVVRRNRSIDRLSIDRLSL